jgi:hypothetical protein
MNQAGLIAKQLERLLRHSNCFYSGCGFAVSRRIDHEQQDAINKRMRGGDQTAATKAAMAEAKVRN